MACMQGKEACHSLYAMQRTGAIGVGCKVRECMYTCKSIFIQFSEGSIFAEKKLFYADWRFDHCFTCFVDAQVTNMVYPYCHGKGVFYWDGRFVIYVKCRMQLMSMSVCMKG